MIQRFASASLVLSALLLCASCRNDTDRTVVVSANQGNFVIKHEPNPLAGQPRPAPATGPTTKEVSQQRRIDELEAQQRSLQSEIERLKRDKGTNP